MSELGSLFNGKSSAHVGKKHKVCFMYWTILCIGQFYVLDNFMYWTILCIGQFYDLDNFMYWTILCIGQFYVYVLSHYKLD